MLVLVAQALLASGLSDTTRMYDDAYALVSVVFLSLSMPSSRPLARCGYYFV
jgi:hypothetical protein